MIAYHGTTVQIEHPDVLHSKKYLDFGKGFYLTTYKEQAERWALRKAARLGGDAVVNIYELDDLADYNVIDFGFDDEAWIDFVCSCRKGDECYKAYDAIIGAVADDDVFKTVDMYARGIWDKERVIQELRYYKKNNQICIVNQSVLDKALCFKKSYKVGDNNG